MSTGENAKRALEKGDSPSKARFLYLFCYAAWPQLQPKKTLTATSSTWLLALHLRQQGQRTVLIALHYLPLARTFVIDSAQVQDAMDDYPVQFIIISLMKQLRIGAHSVE